MISKHMLAVIFISTIIALLSYEITSAVKYVGPFTPIDKTVPSDSLKIIRVDDLPDKPGIYEYEHNNYWYLIFKGKDCVFVVRQK